MRNLASLMCSLILSACTTVPFAERSDHLFRDALFAAPSERVSAAEVFAISDAMKHYLHVEIAEQLRVKGAQQGLIDALYSKSQLKVEYDSTQTRNAAQTFDERTGNCLSLVIMTSALAKELGLPLDRVAMNLQRYGNTLAASIPLALDEALDQGRAQPGDVIALVGFGAGLAWGGMLWQL